MDATSTFLTEATQEFQRYRNLAEQAVADVSDESFFKQLAPQVNSIAVIMKHIGGNHRSRWTDFLTTDGEKPNRHRDTEFVIGETESRTSVVAFWEEGWQTLLTTLSHLSEQDLELIVTIRQEPHTVRKAVLRSLAHTSYHVGQIMYLGRLYAPTAPWHTLPLKREH